MRDNVSGMQVVRMGAMVLGASEVVKSDWVDLKGFEAAALVLNVNTVTDAGDANGIVFSLEHSETTADADGVAVPDEQCVGEVGSISLTDDAADGVIYDAFGYVGKKRYVRVVATTSVGTNALVNPLGFLTMAHREPTAITAASMAAT